MAAPVSLVPSVAWSERIGSDEEQRFAAQSEQIARVQRLTNEKYGNGRALHRKQRLALNAKLDVLDDLPEYAAHGLFARSGTHDAIVRLSNGGVHPAKDAAPDIRGFAIKVLDVSGPGALGIDTTSQDFLLINHSVFSLPSSTEFVGIVSATARGRGPLITYAIRERGFLGGLSLLKALASTLGVPFSGFASETFWSAAPIANGPYAARVRVIPSEPATAGGSSDQRVDVGARIARGPLAFDLQLQFFTDESVTPIEDPTVDWPTPYVTVARLTIPQQDTTSPEGQALQERAEALSFDPWSALAEHRPLGEIMRARKSAYRASQLGRGLS